MKIINKVLFYVKVIFLLVAFSLALYIGMINMDSFNEMFLVLIIRILPYLLLLILFVVTFFFNYENNILCNGSSLLTFIACIIIYLRTIFDKNIIDLEPISKLYYDGLNSKIQILLYLILVSNILLIYYNKKNKIHS